MRFERFPVEVECWFLFLKVAIGDFGGVVATLGLAFFQFGFLLKGCFHRESKLQLLQQFLVKFGCCYLVACVAVLDVFA